MKRSLLLLSILSILLAGCQLEDLKEPCTTGTHLDENDECVPDPSMPEACGFPIQDCTALEGVDIVECGSGKCIVRTCKDGYLLNNNFECERDESYECAVDSDCIRSLNVSTMACEKHQCKITSCEADYKLFAGKCIPSDYCESNSDCNIPDAEVVCTDNRCSIVKCNEGYIQIESKCIAMPSGMNMLCSTDDECVSLPHALAMKCKNNAYCTATECEEGYELKQYMPDDDIIISFCVKSDQMTCLSADDCSPLPDGTNTMECHDFVCVATECMEGYRIEVQGDSCTEITTYACSVDTDCPGDEAALGVICEENQCKYTSCTENYHLKNGACVNNSLLECGGVGEEYDCTAIKGAAPGKVKCTSGKCKVIECEEEYNLIGGKCIQKSLQSCNGIDCTGLKGTMIEHLSCIEGKCVSDKCTENYHLKEGTCVLDNDDECGESLQNCRALVAHCMNAQCIKTECGKGQHIKNNECVQDSEKECGAELKDCTSLPKAAKTSCAEGKCRIDACVAKSHINNNQCVDDSPSECGSQKLNCTDVAGVAKVACTDGACVVSKCEESYTLKDGYCCYDKNLTLKKTKEVRKHACISQDVVINPSVTSVDFPYLVRIEGQLYTTGQSYLASLNVSKLQAVYGGISINSTKLTILEFPSLKKIQKNKYFYIYDNKNLTRITASKTIKGDLTEVIVSGNPNLNSVQLNTTSSELYIENNTNLSCKAICEGMPEISADETYISDNKDNKCNVSGSNSGKLHDKCKKI